jgi:DUF1009 family protein
VPTLSPEAETDEAAKGRALALVAGAGVLPLEAARRLADPGRRLVAVAFHDLSDPALSSAVSEIRWLRLGQLEALGEALRAMGAGDVLLVGKVSKTLLFEAPGLLTPDAEALRLLEREERRGDAPLMAAFAEWLEKRGLGCADQSVLLAALLAPLGPLGAHAPSAAQRRDLAVARPVVHALGHEGVGQCVVVKGGAIVAVEAMEGTDATIARAGSLAGAGATIVKAARPGQDRRFDLPAIGPDTIDAMRAAGATGLAVEAGSTLVVERARTIEAADRAGIAVWGFEPAATEGGR